MAEMTVSRRKRFERSAAPAPMQLTERDLHLLAHVARHRFLSSAQLAALDGGSPQNVLRALRVLFDHGYVDRPLAQLASMPVLGPQPLVYGLGAKGARALREYSHHLGGGGDFTEKNKRAGGIFIEHTLAVAEFMTAIELSCRSLPDVELIREPDIIAAAPEATRHAREPLRWVVRPPQGRNELWSVVPDGLFALSFADGTAAYFMLEIDRGTIPIVRNSLDHRSIARKLATYWEGWKAKRHEVQFGVKQMRVLFVTESADRVRHMLSAVDHVTGGKGSNFFLFIDRPTLAAAGPLEVEWISGKRAAVRLTD
ncbi:MAG TPA: replication-relaxation family protein [Xanthobacteraceae bacterium]|nr:replication-relaxation family protein [Xanthobacteraceae bacterium]